MFSTLWKIGLQVLPWTNYFSTTVPTSCFAASNLVDLVDCLETYTIPKGFFNLGAGGSGGYAGAQPTVTQRADWKIVVKLLLSVNTESCDTVSIPSSLTGIYAVRVFQGYCVLYETTSTGGIYNKGWGFVVVPSLRSEVARRVHISAPHPLIDSGTVQQAAAIFDAAGSNSLLVAGRHRNALDQVSNCIPEYNITDPAHNTVSLNYPCMNQDSELLTSRCRLNHFSTPSS
jgi:hypothetical protein